MLTGPAVPGTILGGAQVAANEHVLDVCHTTVIPILIDSL